MGRHKARRTAPPPKPPKKGGCPCGKVLHSTEAAAIAAVASNRSGSRVYACPYLPGWHTATRRGALSIALSEKERDLIHAVRTMRDVRANRDHTVAELRTAGRALTKALNDATDP